MGEAVEMQMALLEPPHSDFHWPRIEAELDKVPHIWSHRYTKDALLEHLIDRVMQLWVVGENNEYHVVLITQMMIFPAGRVLQVVLAFGNQLLRYLPMIDATLMRFANLQDCMEIEVLGREGFEKILADYGFRKKSVVLSRRVKKETLQ